MIAVDPPALEIDAKQETRLLAFELDQIRRAGDDGRAARNLPAPWGAIQTIIASQIVANVSC